MYNIDIDTSYLGRYYKYLSVRSLIWVSAFFNATIWLWDQVRPHAPIYIYIYLYVYMYMPGCRCWFHHSLFGVHCMFYKGLCHLPVAMSTIEKLRGRVPCPLGPLGAFSCLVGLRHVASGASLCLCYVPGAFRTPLSVCFNVLPQRTVVFVMIHYIDNSTINYWM